MDSQEMKDRFIAAEQKTGKRERIMSIPFDVPKICAELYVRLYSLLDTDPEVIYEGYEFHIKDKQTGIEFSAGSTGFGPGYFSSDTSEKCKEMVAQFHGSLFQSVNDLKECKLEFEHDFGKTVIGYENGTLIEAHVEE